MSSRTPTISVYACILPRLEAFYLEEWVSHHLKLGITHFHLCIYDSSRRIHDNTMNMSKVELPEGGSFVTWGKKPHADYFLDYTDEQIAEKLKEVSDKYPVTYTKLSDLPPHCLEGNQLKKQYKLSLIHI